MNPIVKNEPYKHTWLDKSPIVPNDMALVLYPHDSREHCNVYLQDDIVYPEAIKKWHFDRLVHITLRPFEFQRSFRFSFSDGINQWVQITYKFTISVKQDRNAIKVILKNNVTDVSEPILGCLNGFALSRSYKSVELFALEKEALQKITELLARVSYLKIEVSQVTSLVDDVSKKQIEDDKADKLRREEVEAIKRKLIRDQEEAVARRKEAEIAREKAETERQMAEIRHQAELERQQHNIDIKTKEVAAEKAYQLQQAENVAAIAEAHRKNINSYGLANLAAIDPAYQGYINSQQTTTDLERENKMKDLELARQKILLVKEMVEAGVIDDMTAGRMTQRLLFEKSDSEEPQTGTVYATPGIGVETESVMNEGEKNNISEDGKDNV